MKRILFLTVLAGTFAACASSPKISNVTMVQDKLSRTVTIGYTLSGEAAVVTLAVETNSTDGSWHKIDAALTATASGHKMNVLVDVGTHEFKWRPDIGVMANLVAPCRAVVTAWSKYSPPDYMVVDPTGAEVPRYYTSAEAVPGGVEDVRYKSRYILMRRIHAAGNVTRLGLLTAETDENLNRNRPRLVSFTKDYYIGVYETTQGQYVKFSGGANPSTFKGYDDSEYRPVETYSKAGYDPINAGLLDTIGTLAAQTRIAFTLPTAAQWEYAARAGSMFEVPDGCSLSLAGISHVAWHSGNSGAQTHAVGTKDPNGWGLYDVIGNVWECCRDAWSGSDGDGYSDGSDAVDPCVPDNLANSIGASPACANATSTKTGAGPGYHVRRGGSWENKNLTYLRFCSNYAADGRDKGWWGVASATGFRLCAPCEAK
jgi:formylglycine-generating enzyme required for sulfatase activity